MTAIVLVTVVFLAQTAWRFLVIVLPGLLSPNQDLVYHLSLVGELRHHFPVASPVVDGEPLYYHWFLHAEIAASSWATGIELAVLLLRLSLVPMIVLTLLGAALLAGRLTGSARWGLLAPVLLVVGGVASMAPTSLSTDHGLWLSSRMYISPTIAFAHLLLVPVLALGMRLLSTDVPAPRRLWVAMALALGALSASKATVLPCVMAGFLGVVVIGALRGRLERRALALFAVSAVVFLVARRLVYGNQARGVRWDPLVTYETDAAKLGLAERAESAGLALAVLMLVVFLVQQLSFAAGIVGLVRGQWRDSHAQFLVGVAVAGTVASFTFAANASAQLHFVRTTPVVFAVASVWGLSVLVPRDRPRRLPHLLVATAVVAGALASAVQALNERGVIGLQAHASVWGLVQPYVLAATGVLVLVAACAWASRRWPHWRGHDRCDGRRRLSRPRPPLADRAGCRRRPRPRATDRAGGPRTTDDRDRWHRRCPVATGALRPRGPARDEPALPGDRGGRYLRQPDVLAVRVLRAARPDRRVVLPGPHGNARGRIRKARMLPAVLGPATPADQQRRLPGRPAGGRHSARHLRGPLAGARPPLPVPPRPVARAGRRTLPPW